MSDILIKGMDMPKCCAECDFGYPFRNYIADYACTPSGYYCRRLKKMINEYKSIPDNCPLVEIPTPHGRLIDAGDLFNEIRTNSYLLERRFQKNIGMFLDDIYLKFAEAPTIIEAEE